MRTKNTTTRASFDVSSRIFRRNAIVAGLSLALVFGGSVWTITRWKDVTEHPVVAYSPNALYQPESSITVPVKVDLAKLVGSLNGAAPIGISKQWKDSVQVEVPTGTPKIHCDYSRIIPKCGKTGWVTIPVSVPYHGDARLERTGDIALIGHGDDLEVQLPAKFWVRVSGRGKLGASVHETSEGKFTASARIRATLNPDWTVSLKATPQIEWHGAPGGKLFNLFPYTIRSLLEENMQQEVGKLTATLERQANNEMAMRRRATQAWNAGFATHQVSGDAGAWVTTEPVSLAWSQFSFSDGALRSTAGLTMKSRVVLDNKAPPAPEVSALPAVAKIESREVGDVSLNTPVQVSYAHLSELAMRLAKEADALKLAGIHIKEVQFYPSGDRLAVRVRAKMDMPGQIFGTRAEVHLTGQPTFNASTRQVRLSDIQVRRKVDNQVVDSLLVVLHPLIEQALTDRMQSDITPVLTHANARIRQYTGPLANKGLLLDAKIQSVSLGKFHMNQDAFMVPVSIKGTLSTEIDPSVLAKR